MPQITQLISRKVSICIHLFDSRPFALEEKRKKEQYEGSGKIIISKEQKVEIGVIDAELLGLGRALDFVLRVTSIHPLKGYEGVPGLHLQVKKYKVKQLLLLELPLCDEGVFHSD